MTVRSRWAWCGLVAVLVAASATRPASQVRYTRGQTVAPVFEGWERNADGTFNMVFGYMNRNYEEELEIPVGPDNSIGPGDVDQGQPTHFYARRQEFVFKVRVPKDWGKKDLVWTLTSRGQTEKAYATLLPFWELGAEVYQENRGGPPLDKGNYDDPPAITLEGPAQRTISLSEPLTLTVGVTDDGRPAPRGARGGGQQSASPFIRDSDGGLVATSAARGGPTGPRPQNPLTQAVVRLDPGVRLGVTWVLYRGAPGTVTFEPMHIRVVDGKAVTKVGFSKPGTYVLRAYADDGIFVTPVDVTVSVSANGAAR
jgi:hypothetical protein